METWLIFHCKADHAIETYNEQPWSYIVAPKQDRDAFQTLLSCLIEGNQGCAAAAPVLAIGCTNLRFTRNGKPNAAAVHDLGLASANLNRVHNEVRSFL